MDKLKIEIQLMPGGLMPTQADGSPAGLDLYSREEVRVPGRGVMGVPTGVKMAIPDGWYGKIEDRSGVALSTPLSKKAGVIDPDYRGEVVIILQNISDYPRFIDKGTKIAQVTFHKRPILEVTKVEKFTENEILRGDKGFGSSEK